MNCQHSKKITTDRINHPKPSEYNRNILIGNWFEENCCYKKYKYEHCTEYSKEYNEKAPTVVPASVVWDNKIQSEGHGIHPEVFTDEVPNFYHNFSTLYDLSYNHFPKKFNKRRCLCDKMPDYLKSYGNLTNYGIMDEKREQWKYEQIPIRYTMNEIDFIHPNNECYKFSRWTKPSPVKTKYGKDHRRYPANHPRFSHLNPITWDSWEYEQINENTVCH